MKPLSEKPESRAGKTRPVVLADRDGTLIRDVPYLSRLEDIVLLPGVASSIRLLNERGIPVAIVTNQSGVARGYFPESFILESHARILGLLEEEGATVQGLYYCPHLALTEPWRGDPSLSSYHRPCGCRKPEPGLLLRALEDLSGDPAQSIMIGDAGRDMEAAFAAGCRWAYRIRKKEEDGPEPEGNRTDLFYVPSFEEAVQRFLGASEQSP